MRQFLSAFKPDAKEEVNGNEFGSILGNSQVAFEDDRENSQNKEQESRIGQVL